MNKGLLMLAMLTVPVLLFSGCEKNSEGEDLPEYEKVCGSAEFMSSIMELNVEPTKAGEISEDDVYSTIEPMFPIAENYLLQNGYDYRDDFLENDPNIIMTALALYQFDVNISLQTKGSGASVADVASYIILGSGMGRSTNLGVKFVAKKLAEEILLKAVPGVGAAVAVVMAIACLSELE